MLAAALLLDVSAGSVLAQALKDSGAALGFDRLVMLASGARRIEDVLWTA